MKNKAHGWVLEDSKELRKGVWYVEPRGMVTRVISRAKVYTTRKAARETFNRAYGDVVRKVEINEKGKAVRIIPRAARYVRHVCRVS